MKEKLYKRKIEQERDWYKPRSDEGYGILQRLLHNRLIYSFDRIVFNYNFPKDQMASFVRHHTCKTTDLVLIAPCGRGDDYQYLHTDFTRMHGVDISFQALKSCSRQMHLSECDILDLPFPEQQFNIIVSTLFFHHLKQFGFNQFLKEFHRILVPGGILVIMEPSLWYPLNIITRPLKLLGNPYFEVEDEGPIRPGSLVTNLRDVGFANVGFKAATFSHPSFFIPLAKFVNRISEPFLDIWPLNLAGWLLLYTGQKI